MISKTEPTPEEISNRADDTAPREDETHGVAGDDLDDDDDEFEDAEDDGEEEEEEETGREDREGNDPEAG